MMCFMEIYTEKYESLNISVDATVSGMVTEQVVVAGGSVIISGMVVGDLIVDGGKVKVSGSVGRLVPRSGEIDITGQVRSLQQSGGNVKIAVGASVNGRVLEAGGRWVDPSGSWSIDDTTPRYNASDVL